MKALILSSLLAAGTVAQATEVQTYKFQTQARAFSAASARARAMHKKQAEVNAAIADCTAAQGETKIEKSWTTVSRISKRSYIGRSGAIVTCTLK